MPEPLLLSVEACWRLYTEYLDGLASENSMVTGLRSMALRYCRFNYSDMGADAVDEATQIALLELWALAKRGKLPTESARRFQRYTWRVLCTSGRSEFFHKQRHKVLEKLRGTGYRHSSPTMPTVEGVDAKLFLEDLPTLLKRHLRVKSRWRQPPYADAMLYIVDRVCHGLHVAPNWLRERFGIRKTEWFIENVVIQIRSALYDLRTDLNVLELPNFGDVSVPSPYGESRN